MRIERSFAAPNPSEPAVFMAEGDVIANAKRAIVSYGTSAVDVLDLQAARLRQVGAVNDALVWQQVADAAAVMLDVDFSVH